MNYKSQDGSRLFSNIKKIYSKKFERMNLIRKVELIFLLVNFILHQIIILNITFGATEKRVYR